MPMISPISAMPISAGYDLFETIPAPHDFGGPIGTVVLKGVPIGPGNTDTIVQRMSGVPAGGTGTIPIELVELSLESVTPVNIGGIFFDVFVTIDKLHLPGAHQPDTLTPSVGQILITSHNDVTGGGTMDSFFDIFVDVTLVPVGGNINDPNNVHFAPTTPLHLISLGDPWSHTPPPNYPTNPSFPSGSFFTGPISFNGIHPIVPAQVQSTSIPEFPFSFSLVIIFVVVAAVYLGIRQGIMPNFKRF
jgi:hypothetical protein